MPMECRDEYLPSASFAGSIHHRRFRPAVASPGRVLVLHGLGDHVASHDRIALRLAAMGFEAHGIDWPGHGDSDGSRGDVPGVETAARLIEEVAESGDSPPVGVYAHSTGGYLLLHHLRLLAEEGRPPPFCWVWLSSPLLSPGHGQPELKRKASRLVARLLPRLPFPTGVARSRICHAEEPDALAGPEEWEGFHHVVSARFGSSLLEHESRIEDCARLFPPGVRLLLSQGDEDTICPPRFALPFFLAAAATDKTLLYVRGARHDIFREPIRDGFHAAVRAWIDRVNRAGRD